MAWTERKTWWRRYLRRLNAGVALVAYLVATVGVPMTRLPDKDRSRPFPCQDHACGCRNADACWHHCCCYSSEEKMAWAREHRVEPPPDVQLAANQGWHSVRLRDQEAGCTQGCSGCQPAPPAPVACGHCQTKDAAAAKKPSRGSGWRWVPSFQVLRCQGLSTLWVTVGTVAPPPPVTTWNPVLSPLDWLALPQVSPVSLSVIPPDPPPRGCA